MTDTTTTDAQAREADVDSARQADTEPATAAKSTTAAQSTTAPASATPAAAATDPGPQAAAAEAHHEPSAAARDAALFDEAAAKDLQVRWQAIQVGFVDEPRGAVEQADKLVDEVMQKLADSFAQERGELERAWSGGSEASTEDLRQAIRRYRSFFNRLLAI